MTFRYRIKLFGITEEIVGRSEYDLESKEKMDSEALIMAMKSSFPDLEKIHSLMLAVNQQYSQEKTELNPDDEIALIPPVSGG